MILLMVAPVLLNAQSREKSQQLIDEGISKMFALQHAQSLEMLIKAKSMAEVNGWNQQAFQATNNIGANYYMMLDYGEALRYYLEAYEIASDASDNTQVMTVLNNIAILYFQEKNNEKAYEYFLKAYQLAKENNLPEKRGIYATNLGLVLNKLRRLEEAEVYIKEAEQLVEHDEQFRIMVQMALAENLTFQGNYHEAEEIADAILPALSAPGQAENKVFVLLVLAQIHEGKNQVSQALRYGKEAGRASNTIQNKADTYDYLSRLLAKSRDYELSLLYKDSVIQAKDSLNLVKNTKLYETGKIKFEIQNYQYELEQSQRRLKDERKFFYTVMGAGALVLILVILIFRNNSIKHKQQEKIAELELHKTRTESLMREKQLREKEALALLEQERLKNELELKNRKLTAKEVHQSSRNELIEDVIKLLSQQPEVSRNENLSKYTRELKNHLKQDTQWESFFTHFEAINQGFIDRLKSKHPNLIASEVRFIIYVYMNLSNKEISALLNITDASCRKRKERISKKLDIPSGTNLYAYLSTI